MARPLRADDPVVALLVGRSLLAGRLVRYRQNATGKSTVADALEWYFTGEIGLLRHEGRAGSLRHVGASADEQTSMTVQTTGVLGGSLEPGGAPDASVRTAGWELYLLRGPTLRWFVERTKGEKWKALAELLGLDGIDQLRLDLQKPALSCGTPPKPRCWT